MRGGSTTRVRAARWAKLLAAVLVALLGFAGYPGEQSAARYRPGAADVGDPYVPGLGNGGYDVASYTLRLRYDPAEGRLSGTAVVVATATQNLSRFNLDLIGLRVTAVTVDGRPARYRRDQGELIITPTRGLPVGHQFTVEIAYGGVPRPITDPRLGTNGFLTTTDGAIALGQPVSASTWFPVNDHPSDKATYDIEISVPDGLVALSNGVPRGTRRADGWTTWRWSVRSPMASYLATVVIGDYRVRMDSHNGKPMVTAVASSLPHGPADAALARTGEIADFLERHFGPYPFEAYGGIVIDDERIRYALETQTRPVYSAVFFADEPATWVVAHELAHQWFGDSVSVHRWRDIWLNEGLATYAEWLWEEHDGGRSVREIVAAEYARTDWSQPAWDPGPDRLFTRAVYQRGALAVHAVRTTIGDDAFFQLLRAWAETKRDGNATTAEFLALAQRISGRDVTGVVEAWLAGRTAPPAPA